MKLLERYREGLLPHSLLLVGESNEEAATALIEGIIQEKHPKQLHKLQSGNHPDVHHYYPEGKSALHPIEHLKRLSGEDALTPFEAGVQFFLIHEAERMLPTSANALLKTFEEPSLETYILLLTQRPEQLLPTIRSRCQTFTFEGKSSELNPDWLKLFFALLEGDLAAAKPLSEQLQEEAGSPLVLQHSVRGLFGAALAWVRDVQAEQAGHNKLYYAEYVHHKPLSYNKVEKALLNAHLALNRSVKLVSIFSYLAHSSLSTEL